MQGLLQYSKLQDVMKTQVFLGGLQRVKGLGVIPFLSQEVPELPDVETLEGALAKGFARITETGPGGEVPFLKLENSGERPIIILDGEEVVGGKQNRIVNATLGDSREHFSENPSFMHSSWALAA